MTEAPAVGQLVGALGALDLVVVAAAVAGLLLIAYLSGRREKDTADFFLGGRRVPTFIACLSFVATEISAMTIVAVPARGYAENWFYLQFFIGSAAAKVLIAFLFIPAFYKYRCTTIYEFLRHRQLCWWRVSVLPPVRVGGPSNSRSWSRRWNTRRSCRPNRWVSRRAA